MLACKRTLLCVIWLFIGTIGIEADEAKKTICLNMIVKDETKVIRRCLASVKPIIDYWVIVDTGSTDGTQEMIKEFMKDVPGELHERPWINFGHNRNEALQHAKGKADYILIIDADEVLSYEPNFSLPRLDKDFYYIITDFSGTNYGRVQLVKDSLNWKWTGVLHETIGSTQATTSDTLPGVSNVVRTDGARSQDPRKFHKDAAILEAALKEDPNNSRYQFYLAQSYRDANEPELALKNYEKYIANGGGWDQEIFWAKLQIGKLQEALDMPADKILNTYYDAFHYRNKRAEPLYRLASYYRRTGNYAAGYLIATTGLKIPVPNDILFVENWIYDYGMLLECSICAYWIGHYEESQQACQTLLANPKLPENVRQCVEENLNWANLKLIEQTHSALN